MRLAGQLGGSDAPVSAIHVAEPKKETVTAPMQIHTNYLERTDGGSFIANGFSVGQQVWVSDLAGAWTITALTASRMTLSGAALTPSLVVDSTTDTFTWLAPV